MFDIQDEYRTSLSMPDTDQTSGGNDDDDSSTG